MNEFLCIFIYLWISITKVYFHSEINFCRFFSVSSLVSQSYAKVDSSFSYHLPFNNHIFTSRRAHILKDKVLHVATTSTPVPRRCFPSIFYLNPHARPFFMSLTFCQSLLILCCATFHLRQSLCVCVCSALDISFINLFLSDYRNCKHYRTTRTQPRINKSF